MTRVTTRLLRLAPATVALMLLGAGQASAATVKVCQRGCPYTQLAPALAASESGDTIKIGPGIYAGGVTIDVSVKLLGAGPGVTVIRGGGPVLTIGVPGAASEPTVTIDGVTVTGGAAIGNLEPWSGRGGGIYIPRAAGPSIGATVTIRNSVIRGNRTAPATATESDDPCCAFADSGGGGISNDGTLTLDDTRVSDNLADAAAGLTSSAIGGGILNRAFGTLTLKHSVITDNLAAVSAPNGRYADAGGIAMVGGTLTISDSRVSRNRAEASSAVPSDGFETQATVGGGIQVQGNASATIRDTTITDNSLSSANTVGDAAAFSGGLHGDGPIALRDSRISGNRVTATATGGSAAADSGAGEINADSVISNTRFTGNSVTATSSAGAAHAAAGAIITAGFEQMTISDSVINANRLTATTTTGSSSVDGGAIANIGVLTLRNTNITDNRGTASGTLGSARGGGIFNGSAPDGPPSVRLALVDSAVTRNALAASPGITVQGGGLFTLFPVTLTHSVIARNVPDQCHGC